MSEQPEITPDKPIEEAYSFSRTRLAGSLAIHSSVLSWIPLFTRHRCVRQCTPYAIWDIGTPNIVLDASFVPEWQGHPTVRGRCLITVWAVPSQQRHAAEQLLVAECLPILCRWLARSQNDGNVWRGTEHTLSFEIQDGRLRHSDSSSR